MFESNQLTKYKVIDIIQKFNNIIPLWVVLSILVFIFHLNHPLDSDEGVILEGAWNLINGRELYTDFFEFVTPGSFYLVFWIWKFFGVSYWVANFASIVLIFFGAFGIYRISEQISSSKFNSIPPFIFLFSSFYWPIINYNTFNIFFIIWAVYFFQKGLNSKKYNFIISGLITGLSILFLQQKGIALLFALFSFFLFLFIHERKKIWLKLSLYYLVFSFFPLIILFIKWPISLLYSNLIDFAFFHYVEMLPLNIFLLFFIILISVIIVLRKEKNYKILLLLYVQFILLLTIIPRSDYFHSTLIIFPLCAILPILLKQLNRFSNVIKNFYYCLTFIIIAIIVMPSLLFVTYYPPFSTTEYGSVISYIKKNCLNDNNLYAGPFMPGMYFETRKLNITPYSWLITQNKVPEQFLETARLLKKNKPKCAVLSYANVDKFNYNKDNPVDNYIINNYDKVGQVKKVSVFKVKK